MAFFEDAPVLSDSAATIIESRNSRCYVSIASVWEAAIKVGIGKLHLPYDLRGDFLRILDDCGMELLPVAFEDAVGVQELEPIHGDPFDRIQVIQARRHGLEIISRDKVFDRYGLKRIW